MRPHREALRIDLQRRRQRGGNDTEAHRAFQALAGFADVSNECLPIGKDALRPDEHSLAFRCEPAKLLISFDDADAQLAFELVQSG